MRAKAAGAEAAEAEIPKATAGTYEYLSKSALRRAAGTCTHEVISEDRSIDLKTEDFFANFIGLGRVVENRSADNIAPAQARQSASKRPVSSRSSGRVYVYTRLY